MGHYDVAQICPNGHVANSNYKEFPQFNKEYCDTCGEKTVTECDNCQAPIRGEYESDVLVIGGKYTPPSYCHACGAAFPWTDRAMNSAIELAIESGDLDENEQAIFRTSVQEVTHDTPAAQVASIRIAKLLGKMSTATARVIRDILVEIASEAAKKAIWPEK